jgi:hypothetical protein
MDLDIMHGKLVDQAVEHNWLPKTDLALPS